MAYVEQKSDTELWLPDNIGEFIEGEVIEFRQGQYGKQVVIQDAKARIHVTPSHKVLQSRITHWVLGDKVKITYKGQELPKVKGQQGARIYEVLRDEPPVAEDVV